MATELAALGERPRVEEGGVAWEGDERSVMRANLWLRTASRVLVRVARFSATKFYELEQRANHIDWHRFIGAGSTAEFRVTARKSKLYHSDAISERLVRSVGRRATTTRVPAPRRRSARSRQPASAENLPTQLFVVRVVRDEFEISADSSGDLLHMRGYRLDAAKAPLRETLGAALLLASRWTGDVPLLDPFCGSGTIPIEGALLARRMAPGLRRRFAFMHWPGFRQGDWVALRADAEAHALPRSSVPIAGSDRDAGAIAASRANAARAGVEHDIVFSERSVSAAEAGGAPGLIATNPPYGKRVSENADIRNLYAQFGKVARARFGGWWVTVLVPDDRLAKQLGLPLEVAVKTRNGGLPVTIRTGKVPV